MEDAEKVLVEVEETNPVPLSWTVFVPAVGDDALPVAPQQFVIRDWCAESTTQASRQPTVTGTTNLSVGHFVFNNQPQPQPGRVELLVQPTDVRTKETDVGPFPCTGATCGTEDPLGGIFRLMPPFLHKDPRNPEQPVDWKVLLVAATYGLLASEMVRHKVGTPQQVINGRLQVANQVYKSAQTLLCGKVDADTARAITLELRCLLELWCKSFIYPGPRCDEDPIGVVIGCVRVQGGTIRDIDPLGGRRWVVTYPLLSYWGHQFGIAPLDVTLSRVFSLICCISELAPPVGPSAIRPIRGGFSVFRDRNLVAVGNTYLFTGTADETAAEVSRARISVVRTREVPTDEFVANLVTGLRTSGPPAENFEVLTLADSPDIRIAVPLEPAFRPPADRVSDVVRTTVPAGPARANVPVLVRANVDALSANILRRAPIRDLEQSPLAAELKAAGIFTTGALLSRSPAEVHERVLAGQKAKEFSALFAESEKTAETVSKAVNEVIAKISKENEISSPEELRTEATLKLVTDALATRLSRGKRAILPKDELESVIASTFKAETVR